MATWTAENVEKGAKQSKVVADGLYRTQIVQYAGASGDFNPLHTDEPFATIAAGNPSTFAHGMLTMGMTGKMLTDWVGADRVTLFGGRFTSQVWPGDTLRAVATVEAIREEDGEHFVDLAISTTNQDGREVFSGRASARIDA